MKEKKKHTSVALVVIVLAVFISMCGIMFAKGKKTAGAETASAVPTGTAEEKSGRQETTNNGKKVKTKKKSKNPNVKITFGFFGGASGTRTPDRPVMSRLL